MIKVNCEQGSEEWFNLRHGRITGSKFSDLMAGKETAAYRNLIAEIASSNFDIEDDSDKYVSEDMERGTLLEPEAREFYSKLRGVEVQQIGFILPDNDYKDWIGVSPDGLVGDNGLIEIKCPKISTHLSYISKGVLPNTYKYQVYGLLWVTGLEWLDFISYYPGLKPFIIRVFPDESEFISLESRLNGAIKDVNSLVNSYTKYSVN